MSVNSALRAALSSSSIFPGKWLKPMVEQFKQDRDQEWRNNRENDTAGIIQVRFRYNLLYIGFPPSILLQSCHYVLLRASSPGLYINGRLTLPLQATHASVMMEWSHNRHATLLLLLFHWRLTYIACMALVCG